MTTDVLEDYARRDAARATGTRPNAMSDDEWRRYQAAYYAAYAAAQRGAQIAPHLAHA